MAERKYKTLAELQQAYKTGEITAPLMLDNDSTDVYDNEEDVFEMHPEQVLEEALALLGIPSEHV